MSDCLQNYMGVRGQCVDKYKMYLDDLAGINIANLADVTEGAFLTPAQLVQKTWKLALDQVYNDWLNVLSDYFDYSGIITDLEYEYAGVTSYYGLVNEDIDIEIEKAVDFYKFTEIDVYHFGIISDRAVTGKEFIILDQYGLEIKTVTVDLIEGYNLIDLELITPTNKIIIRFNLLNLRVGKGTTPYFGNRMCTPCVQYGYEGAMIVTPSNTSIGFDLKVKCVASQCEIMAFFMQNLKIPLLYKTGINYLIEAKATSRVNTYTRNSQEKINELLLLWNGGIDVTTGIKTNSAYWQALKAGANSTIKTLKGMRLPMFTYEGSQIINSLP